MGVLSNNGSLTPLTGAECGRLGLPCPAPGAAANDLITQIQSLITATLALAGIVAVVFLIIGAVKFIAASGTPASSGKEAGVASAKRTITYAILGLIVIGLAGIIVNSLINVRDIPNDLRPPLLEP